VKFEPMNDSAAARDDGRQATASGPYENERQARADVADIYEQARQSIRREVLGEANHALLIGACERAGVTLGAYDARILAWLAGWEPQMCAVIVGLIARAHAAGRSAESAWPLLDPYCEAGQHTNCPGRLCQCPDCQHRRPTWPTG
jgi:hypothetical protein